MDEDVAIATSSGLNEDISVNDIQEPLSPIIGSGRKFIKFKSRRKRKLQEKVESVPEPPELRLQENVESVPEPPKPRLQEKVESVSEPKSSDSFVESVPKLKLDCLKLKSARIKLDEAFENVPTTSKWDVSENQDIILRIEKLEVLKVEKTDLVRAISFKPPEIIPNVDNMKFLVDIEHSTSSQSGKNDSVNSKESFNSGEFRGFSKSSIEKSKLELEAFQSNANFKLESSQKIQTTTKGESLGFKKALFGFVRHDSIPKTSTNKDKKLPNNIFEGESFNDLNLENNIGFKKASDALQNDLSKSIGFKNASAQLRIKQDFSLSSSKTSFKNIFEGENFDDLNLKSCGFQSASANMQKTSGNIFEGENFDDLGSKFGGFQTANMHHKKPKFEGGKAVARNIFEGENFSDLAGMKPITTLPPKSISKFHTPFKTPLKSPSISFTDEVQRPSINTPDSDLLKKSSKKRLGCRGSYTPTMSIPEKSLKRGRLMFEEIEEELEAKRIRTSTPLKPLAKPLLCDLTPIQKNSFASSYMSKTLTSENNRLSLNKSTEGTVQDWLENLTKEKRLLEEKLRIINEKQTILTKQTTKTRISPGVLYKSKTKQNRMSLKNYLGIIDGKIDDITNKINPQNAHLVHFTVSDTSQSHIKTSDGAQIVPNTSNKIGLPEIAHSFQLMDNIDPALIPKGWIDNHFRWIVWKLASYERWTKEDCLSVENVMQQLKYRYDLEIDNAKRSILRRIFEKDDCSQRRMVLCVSNIIQKNLSYELELTDGWYSIRTVIDQPLCHQITKTKIKIGLKLMIYGSEIVNCDQGCHPLEAKDSVYLKINYNCTRRVLWWCKLGAQQDSGPFLVPITSVSSNGGKIGRLKCFILRIYPVQYMEKLGSNNVWRNRKAEERREQEFFKQKKCSYKNLQNIQDPQLLYDLVQNSNEGEDLQDLLTSSQKTILYNYTISNKSSSFSNKSHQRAVTSMLKLKLIDTATNSLEIRDFFIWQPSENHLDELKEGDIVSVFNVNCTAKWGLGASKLTEFKREAKSKDERFAKFKRKATKIEELSIVFKQKFREFDCVGFVVRKQIDVDCQKVWLADINKRLLLIKIEDSPNNILVLDTVKECQIISICNLSIKQCFGRHFLAIGGLSVIFARYSQYKHLQEALEQMEQDFENLDRNQFQAECQQKIIKIDQLDGMESSQMTITDMALLECMEKFS
ncbi:unnamed protein product [Ceutorhynchus assimilis]|uniref:Breast cancer type 2 susceptibility protein n=1 Tax=Ceutorhynchus assimilis TaxID=467358 RepID=A0A9N9QM33_9CUCU|nr:unnamed protein product [Ceutorhynchus assimilis]